MRIEKRETYAETCERILREHEKRPATFELLPRADDLQTFDVVTSSRDGENPVEILIGDCYTSVNSRTGVVGFDLDVDGFLWLADLAAEGRPRSQIFCDVRREMHNGQGALFFYAKDAIACVEEYASSGSSEEIPEYLRSEESLGWKLFHEWVKDSWDVLEPDPEFWYVKMVECGIKHARTYYQNWFKPSDHSLTSAMTVTEMIEWMGKDPAFDRRSLQTQHRVSAVQRAINLMDRREVSEAEGRACHEELLSSLAEDDRFWMRWRAFGRGRGWWE